MRTSVDVLPRALRSVAADIGLEYLTRTGGLTGSYPVACKVFPTFADPISSIAALPLQMNFAREVLDMEKEDDRNEYNRIMNYCSAGYGGKLHYLERKFVKKVRFVDGQKRSRIVQRIYIEYYAPYRVITNEQ